MIPSSGSASDSATPVRVRKSVLDAKQRLAEERQKLQLQHQSGSPGIQVSPGCRTSSTALFWVSLKTLSANWIPTTRNSFNPTSP